MSAETTELRPRVLLVDDDPDLLELYRELLGQLPSRPEILTAASGSRALAMLETEPFRLLVCDLKMPKMDGLQVLSVVRRKHPRLRTLALTSVVDEQFRSRVYALGVDLFWHKPATPEETSRFLECIESLLGQENDTGFRGVQSKSLVDIVQLECLSLSSTVLRLTNGPLSGRIWIQNGEVIDAEVGELAGEAAFRKILSWPAGAFESLPPEPSRPRLIHKSYDGLLLESAQALDEARGEALAPEVPRGAEATRARLARLEGFEFALALRDGETRPEVVRAPENLEALAAWTRQTWENFEALGQRLNAGSLERAEGLGPQRHVSLARQRARSLCVGWKTSLTAEQVQTGMKQVLTLWAS